ncbi:MAG: hypothetical protein JWP78_2053 [Mucilaginibacter sp.]|nr:hypothetical protein [Mucilaginibacter sp.]
MKIEELTDRLNDTEAVLAQQGKRINELENKEIKMADYTPELKAIHDELKNMNPEAKLDQLMAKFDKIENLFENQPKQVNRQYRLLLFPETDQGQYYKIVFGRLIPWSIFFMVATYLFFLAENGIEAWGNVRYNQQSEQCVRAWLYLNDHASKHIKKAMDQAWEKSLVSKEK